MDSIDKNQPEENRKDLHGKEAVERIKTMVQASPNCFFCTAEAEGLSRGERPMNVRTVDDAGTLWFLSASDSHKNRELASDPTVKLYFQGSKHSDFLQLDGHCTVSTDKAKIEQLWEPILKNWFTGGIDDPRITVLKFVPKDGYYWDTKHGGTIAGIKMMIGAAIGTRMDDSIEGTLKV